MAAGALGATAANDTNVRETMAAASRVQAHRAALEVQRVEAEQKVMSIALPFQCDRHFCRRDDWGRDNRANGIEIGLYQHEDQNFQANNQHVWILHIELSARERPNVAPASPIGFSVFDA